MKQWVYEPEMEFLREHLNSFRKTTTTLTLERVNPPTPSTSTTPSRSCSPEIAATSCDSDTPCALLPPAHEDPPVSVQGSKKRKRNELDDAMLTYIRNVQPQNEDPLVGWFKSFIPHLKTLSPMRLIDFQAKVTAAVGLAVAEEEQERASCPQFLSL